ncbi:hypothetical protein AAC387_Pa02g0340 [Persea americana]
MQSLSIWSWKGDFLATPHLDSDFISSYSVKHWRRRKEIWGVFGHCRQSCSLSFYSSSSRGFCSCNLCGNLNLQKGCFLHCSKPHCVLLKERRTSSFGAWTSPTSALEQEVCGSEISESSDLDHSFSVEFKNNEVDNNEEVIGMGEEEECVELEGQLDDKIDVRALAQSLQSAKNADDIENVLKNFKELPLPVYSSIISGFGKDKIFDSAMALVEWLKRKGSDGHNTTGPNLFIYNSLLGAVRQCKQFGVVDRVMEDMAEQGIIPNVVTYNTLMAIYVDQCRPNEAFNVMFEIQQRGLSPSHVTYSIALLAYRRMEDANGALRFFIETREKYKNGEVVKTADEDLEHEYAKFEDFAIHICYQVMRRWLVKGDHLVGNVLRLLSDMDKAELHPSRMQYERLVWACTRESHYVVAKELYTRIRELEDDISLSVCNHVIWLMGKAKKWWAALEIYEDLLDKGPKPNNLSYELIISHFNILLSAASKKGIWRWGVRLINKMQEKGLKPRSREWNSVLVACSKASETAAAVQIFRRMVDQGEKPTILSYGALLSALEKGKMYDEALQVWKHMCKVGVKQNLYAYTILVSVYIGKGQPEEVDSVIREMVSSGIEPTVVTFNAIISGCANSGLGSAAFEWFHRMKVQNIKPNEITYEMLILALARDGKPRLAYELYLSARKEGLRLSSKVYDAVKVSSQIHNASIDLNALGPRPPEKKRIVKIRKVLSKFCKLADVPRRSKPFDKDELYTSPTKENQ